MAGLSAYAMEKNAWKLRIHCGTGGSRLPNDGCSAGSALSARSVHSARGEHTSNHFGGGSASRGTREETSPQERPLERPVTMHPPTAEARSLAGGEEAGHGSAVGAEHPRREIRL